MFTRFKQRLFCKLVRNLKKESHHVANRYEHDFHIDYTHVRVIFRDMTKEDDYSREEIIMMQQVVEHAMVKWGEGIIPHEVEKER